MALPASSTHPDDIDPESGPVYSLSTHTVDHLPVKKCEDNKLMVIVLTILSAIKVRLRHVLCTMLSNAFL